MEARGLPVASAQYTGREIIYEVTISPTGGPRQHPLTGNGNNGWKVKETGRRIIPALLTACDIAVRDGSDLPRSVRVKIYRE